MTLDQLSGTQAIRRHSAALRFIYEYNSHFEHLPKDKLEYICNDIIDCITVCRKSVAGLTNVKDPFTIAKLLYHLVIKFTKLNPVIFKTKYFHNKYCLLTV